MATIYIWDSSQQKYISFSGGQGATGAKGEDGLTPYIGSNGNWYLGNNDTGAYAGDITPSYVIEEAERVVDEVIAAQGTNTFTFAAIADLHYGNKVNNTEYVDGIKHACQAMKYIDSRVKLDMIAVLGDYTDGYPASNLSDAKSDFKKVNSLLNDLRFAPNLRLQGNHDYYADNFPITHSFIQAYSEDVVWGNKLGGYFYKDFDSHKLRIIGVNTEEEGNNNISVSNAQYEWFIQTLDLSSKTDSEEWQTLILSHRPLDWYTSTGVYVFPKIINGYNNGHTNSSDDMYKNLPISFDFSKNNNKARIVANFHGHIHNLLTATMYLNLGNTSAGTNGVYRISTPNACYGREDNRKSDGTPNYPLYSESSLSLKTRNSATDTAFCVYCVDLDSQVIKAICYGAGYDRYVSYGSSGETIASYTIRNNLTNVTTSNSAANASQGSSYSATLSALSGYTLSTVTVTMGGVDITSTAYSNGNVNITNVTGNVVITALAIGDTVHAITNNLTYVSNSNSATSIADNGSYSATLTALKMQLSKVDP